MIADLPIVTTSLITRAVQLAKDAVLLDCIGVITGPNGSGKSVALRTTLNRYASLGLDGVALYHRACATQGHTRGVKDILFEFGIREAHVSSSNLQIACKLGLREFSARKIRLLLLDGYGDILACLHEWCGKEGAELALRAKSQPEAIEVIRQVALSTEGNMGRVTQFAELKNDKFPDMAFTPSLVKDVFSELRGGGAVEAKK